MQQIITERVTSYIEKMSLKPGDRLPAERKFAKDLNISRNSLRRQLHIMEGRGLVEIKKGSGTFLKTRFFSLSGQPPRNRETAPGKQLADQLEIAAILLPPMVELAARRMDSALLDRLQKANINLGRSIFSNNPREFWQQSLAFLRLIALGTQNNLMLTLIEEIYNIDGLPEKSFLKVTQANREHLFGHHVNLLNALKKKNPEKAFDLIRVYIQELPQVFGLKKERLPETLKTATDRTIP